MNIPTETKPPVTPGGYEALVEEAKKPIVQARRRLLAYYWELGRVAADALKPEFGSRTVERFAKDLGLECATVHFAVQFYRSYRSKQALEKVSQRGLSWGHVRLMLSDKVDQKTRERLAAHVEKERIGVKEFAELVKKTVGPTKTPMASTVNCPPPSRRGPG